MTNSGRKTECRFQTIYDKTYEDKAQEFLQPSLTDQSYFVETDIYTLLAQGHVGIPASYGIQDFSSLDSVYAYKEQVMNDFKSLTVDEQREVGGIKGYLSSIIELGGHSNLIDELRPSYSDPVVDEKVNPSE